MDVGRQKHMRDDQTSNCWSYGSINHPASQSRKMSIGVVVDSIAKKKSKCAKEREFMGPNAEEGNANVSNTIQGKFNSEEVTPAKTTTETRTPEQVGSPWISTRPFQKDIPISDAVVHAKQASIISSSGKRQYKLDGARNTPLKYSLDFFTNKTSILQSGDNKHKKFSGVTEKKRELNDGNEEEVQDFTFANVQEVVMQDKEVLVDKTDAQENTRTGTLRMKLWNILGAAASPNDQHPKSQEPEVGRDNLIPQSEVDQMADLVNRTKNSDEPADKYMEKGDAFIKHRQNSDTIETDSESPSNTVRRPVTRSLIRKRAQAKVGRTTTKPAPSSGYTRKQRDNVYSFEQEFYEALQDSAGKSSKFQKRENTGFRNETHEVCLPEKDNSAKKQSNNRRGKRPPAKKDCPGGTKLGHIHGSLPADNEKEFTEQEKTIPEKEIRFQKKRENTGFRTETHEVCLPEKDNPTKIQQAIYRRGKRPSAKKACSGGTKMGDFQGCLPDGENEFPEQEKTVPEKEFDSSQLISKKFGDCDKSESKNHQQGSENPSSKNPVNSENNFLSPTFGIRGPVSISSPSSIPKSDQRADCSSPARMERRFDMGDFRGFRSFSTSKQDFSENGQTQSSDAAAEIRDSPLMKTAPEMEKNYAESGLSLSSSEERDLETFEEGSPVMQGHKWTVEDNCMEEPSDPNEVDGLARAVELFALGLEKLKTKMKTATTRKSSEILTSVAAEVQLRLQNVESQIQTDMGKLTNLSKSKRKKLETRFEEQQGQLKVICDKFKEQINQHLQDCKSTFEGLDVYQTEFKGTVEKQKASHRKLVSQVEEAIENQLNDAQKRIKVMNETRRGQMLQLKRQLASCLREGILS